MTFDDGIYLYVAENRSENICVLRMSADGSLTKVQDVPVGGHVMPLAISSDRRHLFAAIRSRPFRIACFGISATDGTLTPTAEVPAPESLLYLNTDRDGRYLIGACNPRDDISRRTGVLTTYRIGPHGVLQVPEFVLRTPPKLHAAIVDPSNQFVLAPMCDADMVMRYRLDSLDGHLSSDGLSPTLILPKSGPRHITFHPNGKFVYLVNEYDGSVVVFRWTPKTGALVELQTATSNPPERSLDENWFSGWRAADLHFTPDGRVLYVSIRNISTIAAFHVDPVTGLISSIGFYETAVEPRSFTIDPSGTYLIAVGLEQGCLATFLIEDDGTLTRRPDHPVGEGPNWIESIRLP